MSHVPSHLCSHCTCTAVKTKPHSTAGRQLLSQMVSVLNLTHLPDLSIPAAINWSQHLHHLSVSKQTSIAMWTLTKLEEFTCLFQTTLPMDSAVPLDIEPGDESVSWHHPSSYTALINWNHSLLLTTPLEQILKRKQFPSSVLHAAETCRNHGCSYKSRCSQKSASAAFIWALT